MPRSLSPSLAEPIRPDELDGLFAPLLDVGRPVPLAPAVALAVSGGSDSTALMVLFAEWLRGAGREPSQHTVLTVDHGLREQSAAEAQGVAAQAHGLGYRHATLVWHGAPHAGVQAAARAARYRLMGAYMRAHGIALLLTAHTREDQAETLLMRLARGSGLDGLTAMAPVTDLAEVAADHALEPAELALARPLLGLPKARLVATLEARGITWVEDPSNQSPAHERSRLRAAKAQLDALGLTDAMLALSAGRLRRARAAIEEAVAQFCRESHGAVHVDPCGYVTVDRGRLQRVEAEIALRVLGRAIAAAGGSDQPVPLAKLEAIVEALRSADPAGTAKWTLARAMITAKGGAIIIEREPGREPLPRLTMAAGEKELWDGRFRVGISPDFAGGPVEVSALGSAEAGRLLRQDADASHVPAGIAAMVPCFRRGDRLIAVPPLNHWANPCCRAHLRAEFTGMNTPARAFSWRRGAGGLETS